MLDLASVRVEPARMDETPGYRYPVYRLWAGDDEYEHLTLVKGGAKARPDDPVVSYYRLGSRRLILKSIPHGDSMGELQAVRALEAAPMAGVIVPARIVHDAVAPEDGKVGPSNFTVVAMPDGGRALTSFSAGGDTVALYVTGLVCRKVRELFGVGLAYTDLKPDNVLHNPKLSSFVLCDYGSLVPLGCALGVSTYPPPEWPLGMEVLACERAVIYGLGVVLAASLHPQSLDLLQYSCDPDPEAQARASAFIRASNTLIISVIAEKHPASASVLRHAWLGKPTLQEFQDIITRHVS
jgi:hypothetical protein